MKICRYFILLFLLPVAVQANDFPTLERVDYVLTCMKKHGGQTVDNLYACSCEIDAIAQKISFDSYVESSTYASYKRMPGERGGLFRDNERGEKLADDLEVVKKDAEKRCFIGARHNKAK